MVRVVTRPAVSGERVCTRLDQSQPRPGSRDPAPTNHSSRLHYAVYGVDGVGNRGPVSTVLRVTLTWQPPASQDTIGTMQVTLIFLSEKIFYLNAKKIFTYLSPCAGCGCWHSGGA